LEIRDGVLAQAVATVHLTASERWLREFVRPDGDSATAAAG
jgi:hypothetical protein